MVSPVAALPQGMEFSAALQGWQPSIVRYNTYLFLDYKRKPCRFASSLMKGVSGDDPEGGASVAPAAAAKNRSPREVGTSRSGSGGNARDGKCGAPPPRLRWACLPAEAAAKAGAPAERHGGAPKGERAFRGPSATYAPRLTRAAHSRRKARQRQEDAPVGAPPTPRLGG
jgi:hypothetical protein